MRLLLKNPGAARVAQFKKRTLTNLDHERLAWLNLAHQKLDAARSERGESVAAPGVPKHYPDAKKPVTEDCIRPLVVKE